MSEAKSFIHSTAVLGFGPYGPEDELLHPEERTRIAHDALTETQYFGFSVPEEQIHGLAYFWHHPNLGTMSGGVAAWRGIKPSHMAAELYDMRLFMSDKQVTGNINSYKTAVGYEVEVIEPFKQMRIRYEDATRGNALDITYTAISTPAMLPNRHHFEQTMRTKGSIKLRGTTYPVNGYNVRDRSWGEARQEDPTAFPPIVWLTGVFGDDFSFNCTLTEDPARHPEWEGLYQLPEGQGLKGGWIYKDGKHTRVVEASRLTHRDPITLRPMTHELLLIDENGERYELFGSITSSSPAGYWPNVSIHVGLTRWQCNGRIGWGDSQEVQWNDFVYAMLSGKQGGFAKVFPK